MAGYIRDRKTRQEPATEEFDGFKSGSDLLPEPRLLN